METENKMIFLVDQMFVGDHNKLGRSEAPLNYSEIMESIDSSIKEIEKILPTLSIEERKIVLFESAKQFDLMRARFREEKKENLTEHKKGFITFLNERIVTIIALIIRTEKDWQLVKRADQMITPIYYFEKEKTPDVINSKVPWTPMVTIDQQYAVEIFSKRFESVTNRRPDLKNEIDDYKKFLEQNAPKIE
ncbi:MAG: hypothetical protein WC308_03115 [archaeon]|jgi:hypothetical protein